jgi:hypothetical protein
MPPPPVPQHTAPSSRRATHVQHLEELERGQSFAVKDADRQDAERQSSLISSMNSGLEDMMQPEQITQGDTQTQGAFQHSAFEDAVTVTPTTFRGRSVQSSHLHTPITTDTFLLLAETQQTIAARKPYLLQSASALAKKAGGRTESGQMMLCQCGFGKDEGDTVWTSLMISLTTRSNSSAGSMFVLLNLAASPLLRIYRCCRPTPSRRARLLLVPFGRHRRRELQGSSEACRTSPRHVPRGQQRAENSNGLVKSYGYVGISQRSRPC